MIDVSIVIPFYNESDGITTLLDKINKYEKIKKFSFEIIFIDDGSDDHTKQKILNYKGIDFSCKIISFSKNFGSHSAIRAGFMHSQGKYSTYLPADLQISFDSIETMYETALNGYEVICGVRSINKIGFFEKKFSHLYADLMRRYVTKQFPDEGLETILICKKVREIFNSNIEANSSFALQILTLGFKKTFVNINKEQRALGKSKWTLSKKIKLIIDSFVAFSFAPIRLVSFIGVLFFIIGSAWTSYILFRKLFFNDLASGYPALMSVLMLGFGITNISLGIIAEYLWRTLDASRKRPVFIIDNIIELKG